LLMWRRKGTSARFHLGNPRIKAAEN
jgi:hypothetical protein